MGGMVETYGAPTVTTAAPVLAVPPGGTVQTIGPEAYAPAINP